MVSVFHLGRQLADHPEAAPAPTALTAHARFPPPPPPPLRRAVAEEDLRSADAEQRRAVDARAGSALPLLHARA